MVCTTFESYCVKMTPDLPPEPAAGRIFRTKRRIRLSDTTSTGRLRLDAIARYLQDVALDDVEDAFAVDSGHVWVVRRTDIDVVQAMHSDLFVDISTWASGVGARWASRRSSLTGDAGGRIEVESTWVHLSRSVMRMAPLPHRFHEIYGEAASGRRTSGKLTLPPDPPGDADRIVWPLRVTDLDILGHVNNAAYWEAVEQVIASRDIPATACRAVMEYREPIDLGSEVALRVGYAPLGFTMWIITGEIVAAVASVHSEFN